MSQVWPSFAAAEDALATPLHFEEVLSRLGPRDRVNVEKHLAICDLQNAPEHARLWQNLISILMTLAPDHTKSFGRHALQFYVPDGRYRMQVFALHDAEGQVSLYTDDVVEEALERQLLTGPVMPNTYRMADSKDLLMIERIDPKNSNPQPFFKEMMGWNRRAMRISIPIGASDEQLAIISKLCALAAKSWVTV